MTTQAEAQTKTDAATEVVTPLGELPATKEKETTQTSEKQSRASKKQKFVLGWLTEVEDEIVDGVVVPGPRCFVEMALPPCCDEKSSRNRDLIKKAVRKAVYEEGFTEYGNKSLAVLTVGEIFDFQYVTEEIQKTVLRAPKDGESPGQRVQTVE